MTERPLITAVGGYTPVIGTGAFVAPRSVVIGDVTLGPGVGVWYGAVLRADCSSITVGRDSNIQDNCTVHGDPGFPVRIGERVSVGHNAVVHGCTVEDECLIGMGATVLNGAVIGAGSLVAAQALVPQGMRVPPGSLVAGVPAKVRRQLTDEEREGLVLNATGYMELAKAHGAEHGQSQNAGPAPARTARDGATDLADGPDGGGGPGGPEAEADIKEQGKG